MTNSQLTIRQEVELIARDLAKHDDLEWSKIGEDEKEYYIQQADIMFFDDIYVRRIRSSWD